MAVNWEVLQDPVIIARLVLQVALFAASAFFSMSETALFSLREADLQRLDSQGNKRARGLRNLLDEPRQLIVSILCGNELINIAATVNLAGIFLALFADPTSAAIANTAIMLPLLLMFSEITPKTLAVTNPVMLSTRIVEPVMTSWVRLVMPLRAVVRLAADRLTTLLIGEAGAEKSLLSDDEFHSFLLEVEKEGVVTAVERRLIVNLIEAGSTPVSHIMVPRPQVAFISADIPVPDIIEQFRRHRHRRVPVFRGHRDDIVGVIKEERVLALLVQASPGEIELDQIMEPATLVPTTQTVAELAEFFKDGDHHAALIVNEFGGIDGLVSSDDVFSFLTSGRTAFLARYTDVEEMAEGAFLCRGLTPLSELRGRTGLPVRESDDIATAGGLVMALMKRLPACGDEVVDDGLVFRVLSMNGLLIDRLLIAPRGHPVLDAQAGSGEEENNLEVTA